jgi:hypothetical protein
MFGHARRLRLLSDSDASRVHQGKITAVASVGYFGRKHAVTSWIPPLLSEPAAIVK